MGAVESTFNIIVVVLLIVAIMCIWRNEKKQ